MNSTRLNLNEYSNIGCKTKCNKQDRIESTENDLCKGVNSILDDLPVRCVGPWAIQKIYHLYQYFGIFTSGMKNKWNEINYIEICSGPGRCINRDRGIEFDGTALSIIRHDSYKHLHKALFFDFNPVVVDTLNQRLQKSQVLNSKAFVGDYFDPSQICVKIDKEINSRSLNLVLIDPTDCSVPFDLIRHLKRTIPNMDLIINIATGTDYNRNIKDLLLNQEKFENLLSKYAKFLDSHEFFSNPENIKLAEQSNNLALRNSFRKEYEKKLISLGFNFFRFKRIQNYYDLLFATANEKGLDFWDKANRYTFDGQKNLF